jgi:hypothetical protein
MYAGNATVVSILMRWPILIPLAISTAIITELPPAKPVPDVPPQAQIFPTPPGESASTPLPPLKKLPPPDIRTKCPPPEKTAHLSKGAKEALRHYGCKVNG